MLVEELNELFLKALFAMVVLLVFNISNRSLHLRSAYTERPVSFLPLELSILWKRVVYPFGRPAFDQLHCLRKTHR